MNNPYILQFFSILRHKWYVFLAGLRVGVPVWALIVHDLSKFSRTEFGAYARKFELKGEKAEKGDLEFALAWLRHENSNAHHWGFWIARTGTHAGRALPMPERYIKEMVADWMGAGRTYTGSWGMSEWLNNNLESFTFYPETYREVRSVLIRAGYFYSPADGRWYYAF